MSEEVEELEKAVSGKDENAFIDITLKHSNEQRVKLREDYQSKYSKDLLKDIESNFKGDFKKSIDENSYDWIISKSS